MVKKRVLDLFNSSLWSASPFATDDDHLHCYDSKPSTVTPSSLIAPLVLEPPPLVIQEEPPKPEPKEFVNNVHEASSNSSAVDISRQAQLLAKDLVVKEGDKCAGTSECVAE